MQTQEQAIQKRVYGVIKRALDILLSASLLLFLWLPMLLTGLVIRLTSKGPAIFRQIRVGREGQPFTCYKFRTMYEYAPKDRTTAEFTDADQFITPVGRLLRHTGFDELPQLWNVLLGHMSLVGPRPLIPKEKTVHELRLQNGVYHIKPGITGLAQISGRDSLPDEEKAKLDLGYAQTMSFFGDCKILWRTVGEVFWRKDTT